MAFVPGRKLLHYHLVGRVGQGGMGEVWRATDTALGRDVAIKLLPIVFSGDPERLARLEREAKLLASLNHPHIATVFGLHDAGDVRFIAMEFVAGEDLAERMARGPVPIDEACTIARQIADALESAHETGVVHRDLKPANVKLLPDGRVKVLDFGLAKAVDPGTGSAVDLALSPTMTSAGTIPGVIMGTAGYMSPEQARGRPVDRRADLWALGVIIWEMLTGRRLFTGETATDIIAAVVRGPIDFDLLPDGTPPAVLRLLRRCLARDPAERLRSAGDAALELREALAPDASIDGATATARRRSWLPWLVAGTSVLTAAVLGLGSRNATAPELPLLRFQVTPPVGASFDYQDSPVALAPDGLRYVCRQNPDENLIVRFLEATAPVSLKVKGYDPFWSPDGERIGYFTDHLMTIDAGGGQSLALTDVVDGRGGSWSSRGVLLYSPGLNSGLFSIPVSGGQPTAVTTVDHEQGEIGHWRPWFLPDGRHFLFMVLSSKAEAGGIYAGDLDSPLRKRLLPVATAPKFASGHLLWLEDRRLMARPFDPHQLEFTGDARSLADSVIYSEQWASAAFSASNDGVLAWHGAVTEADRRVGLYGADGRLLETIGLPGDSNLDLAPDGRRLAVTGRSPNLLTTDVWILDFERGVRTRFTLGDGPDYGPVWSPDGLQLAWAISSSTGWRLMVRNVDGIGGDREILAAPNVLEPVDWSPDGRWILYEHSNVTSWGDMSCLPAGGGAPVPFESEPQAASSGRFAPDGRHVAYVSDESGRQEIYVQPFPVTGAKWQVSGDGGDSPRWSADGRHIYYVEGRKRMMEVDVRSADPFSPGTPRRLFEIDSTDYESLADGRFVASVRGAAPRGEPIDFITGWPRLMPAR